MLAWGESWTLSPQTSIRGVHLKRYDPLVHLFYLALVKFVGIDIGGVFSRAVIWKKKKITKTRWIFSVVRKQSEYEPKRLIIREQQEGAGSWVWYYSAGEMANIVPHDSSTTYKFVPCHYLLHKITTNNIWGWRNPILQKVTKYRGQ